MGKLSPLSAAAKAGMTDEVISLVRGGADIDQFDEEGVAPISRAVLANNLDMIRLLADLGADLDIIDKLSCRPLHIAIRNNKIEVVKTLYRLGALIEDSMIVKALKWGHIHIIDLFDDLEAEDDLSLQRTKRDYKIPLLYVLNESIEKNRDVVMKLVELHGGVFCYDILSSVVDRNMLEVADIMIKKGASIDVVNDRGESMVHKAANVDMIEWLHKRGADINKCDKKNITPLLSVVSRPFGDYFNIVTALVECKADVDMVTNKEYTPLTLASDYRKKKIFDYLISVGADIKHCLRCAMPFPLKTEFTIGKKMMSLCERTMNCYCHSGQSYTKRLETINSISNDMLSFSAIDDATCAFFSLTKLITNAPVASEDRKKVKMKLITRDYEANVALTLRCLLSDTSLVTLQAVPFLLKRKLACIAWRALDEALLCESSAVQAEVRLRWHVVVTETVCLFLDTAMLQDLLSLRMTCQSNHDARRRRFPVYVNQYTSALHELEVNMIEEWVSYASSRFVSTEILHAVLRIHLMSRA
mmetsp:Transcript_17114/g.28592  ORF Transcript_17114/g.28592 Transcript_17114/m.28592 type:complete len:530 (+) Transcript_17114:149-1738(+)